MKRIFTAIALGVMWAIVWAAVGALVGVLDRGRSIQALWLGPAIGIQPGFASGVMFSVLLGIVSVVRGSRDLSSRTSMICGAIAGLIVGVLPFLINRPPSEAPLWLVGLVVIGSMTLLSVVLAAGSMPLVRRVGL